LAGFAPQALESVEQFFDHEICAGWESLRDGGPFGTEFVKISGAAQSPLLLNRIGTKRIEPAFSALP
jgi:hypothetical protein